MSGQKIIDGLRDAVAGNLSRVHIDGQTWERVNRTEGDPPAEQECQHLGEQFAELLKEITRLRELNAEMLETLRPFADFAEVIAHEHPGWDHDFFTITDGLTMKPFRAARAIIRKAEGKL